MTMGETTIQVDHVSKVYRLYEKPRDRIKEAFSLSRKVYYKEHYALQDVSFSVCRGETVGIIGVNGAGKSTILKIITGVLNPTEGNVTVNGRISALLELGAGFNMEYTGIENVYLNGTMIGFSREEIDKKLDDILAFADIGDFVYQPVKTYSSGMFVRLAFAVAINIDPEILIVDEALSVGDAFFQVKCYHKFEEFKRQGRTILFVSHDLGSIQKYCDRVVLLDKGRKLAEGAPKDMIDLYKKVMVGLETSDADAGAEAPKALEPEAAPGEPATDIPDGQLWRSYMEENPKCSAYGNGAATILDYCVMDQKGRITNVLGANEAYTVRMKVQFHQRLSEPVFALTLRDKQGTEICGTNTMYEDFNTGEVKDRDIRVISFTQQMNLKGGEYLLCLGCTGFNDGQFEVYHRLYDTCLIRVTSGKMVVGYFDMQSRIDYAMEGR
jgi:teichoic acid transport system ATP-binding protein